MLKAELANHTKQARSLRRLLRDSSPPFRTDPKRCRPTRRSINRRQGRDGSNRKKNHPPLLAAPSRYSTAWTPSLDSTPSITATAADPSLLPKNRDRFLSSPVGPASTTTYVRCSSSKLALRDDSQRCPALFDCALVASLKG